MLICQLSLYLHKKHQSNSCCGLGPSVSDSGGCFRFVYALAAVHCALVILSMTHLQEWYEVVNERSLSDERKGMMMMMMMMMIDVLRPLLCTWYVKWAEETYENV